MDILEHVLLEWPCAVCGGTCTIPARIARSESSIEHAGHYDTDTYPPPSSLTVEVLERERDAAVALADEILGRCGYPCC